MKLPVVTGKDVIKALSKAGFVADRQRVSHVRLEKNFGDDVIKVTVPLHNPLKTGTLARIIKDSGLSVDEFVELL
jgi:predicted RNA binding protein YcfA (HicA-like mRNA interferase family)